MKTTVILGAAAVLLSVGVLASAGAAGARRTRTTCLVPNVKWKAVAAAEHAIKHHHCGLGTISRAFSATVAKGLVVSQRPHAGARRPRGSAVGLAVSKGAPLPTAGTVVARISIPNSPMGLLALPGAVWAGAHEGNSIYRIDTATNKVVAHVIVAQNGEKPGRMIFGDGTFFAVNASGNTVSLIDSSLNTVKSAFHAPFENCCMPAYGAGSLWQLEYSSSSAARADRLVRLAPSGQALMTMTLSNAFGLTFGAGSVWGTAGGQVFRLDPTTDQIVAHIPTDAAPVAFGAGSVWGLSANDDKVVRIDPATNSVSATIRLPGYGSQVTATDNAIWVTEGPPDAAGWHLWKIDPAANRVVGQVKLGLPSDLDGVTVGDNGDVWVSEFSSNQVLRIHPTS